MNIAICDDSEIDALATKEVINKTLKELHLKADISYFLCAEDIEDMILKHKECPDILILDIDMPEISGLQLAEKLRANNLNLIIIFLSNHEEFVFKAIEFQPFRYIRKIKLDAEMPIAIRSAVNLISANNDLHIFLNTDDGETKVMMSEILYYETEKRKVAVHLKKEKKILLNKTISEIPTIIDNEKFIMIHRSCVVNSDHIESIHNYIITLDNNEQLIVSRLRYKDVKQKILKMWGKTI